MLKEKNSNVRKYMLLDTLKKHVLEKKDMFLAVSIKQEMLFNPC